MTQIKYKERLVPEQNKPLIAGICVCQLTVVLSIVSFIYLTVAIYMPTHRIFTSGYDPTPVTCQTVETVLINNCSWASCGEWCLTKTTGFCPQIHVAVRRNGTEILMDNCSSIFTYFCPAVQNGDLSRYNCNNGSQCSHLTGFFNCSLGHCSNMTERYQCQYKADGIKVDSDKDNLKLNGFFSCNKSTCYKVKKPSTIHCDRICPSITTLSINAYLLHHDGVTIAHCKRGLALTMANGTEPGSNINVTEFWREGNSSSGVIMASCENVEPAKDGRFRATDCLNGTVLSANTFPSPFMNFTTLWSIYDKSNQTVDKAERFLPPQQSLTIYNHSRLFINSEGCVNTLRGECKAFHDTNGRDGRNRTGVSRFPCYYDKNNSFKAIARFDLDKAWLELVVALVLPSVLFVVSCTTLMVITKSVKVGDDTILRCSLCVTRSKPNEDIDEEVVLTQRNNIAKVSDNNGGAMVL